MRAMITVIGRDRKGIIAGVSTVLADNGINILDISQTIMQEYFTISDRKVSLVELIELLDHRGQELGVSIKVQHEDIFRSMHRI